VSEAHGRTPWNVAIEGVGLQGTAQVPPPLERRGDEELVAVRREVLNDVEHAVGNLLQRMHHVARAAKNDLGPQSDRLEHALNDLERLLELLFDYVSPVEVEVRPTSAQRIAESLAAQLQSQGVAEVTYGLAPGLQVLADARVMSRSVLLLAPACARACEGGGSVRIEINHDAAGDRVQFSVQSAAATAAPATAQHELAAAVAGRLIELQGGELHVRPRPACACAIILPVAS
jgi:hypothetical protein